MTVLTDLSGSPLKFGTVFADIISREADLDTKVAHPIHNDN